MNLLDAALGYAACGMHVFPLEPGGKKPLDSSPEGAHLAGTMGGGPAGKDRATLDPGLIRAWWTACPTSNVGIAAAPSGLVIVDADVADGKPGLESLHALQQELGVFPQTLTQRTGRGGYHLIYRRPADMEPVQRLKFKPALDIIGKGYIVAWPSTLNGGGSYVFHDVNAPIAELPAALAGALTRSVERDRAELLSMLPRGGMRADEAALQQAAMELAAHWPKSGRHVAQLALAGALAKEGWEPEEIAGFCAAVAQLEPGRPAGYDGEYMKRLSAARDSYSKVEQGLEVAAWGTLAQHLGTDGKRVVESVGRKLGVGADGEAFRQAMLAAGAGARPLPAGATGIVAAVGAQVQVAAAGGPGLAPRVAKTLGEIAANMKPPVRSYSTGFADLDRLMGGGISTRQLATLCAPPASGKSAFAVQLALNLEQVVPVLVVSTELESDELVARYGANILDLVWRDAVRGKYREEIAAAVGNLRIHVIGCDDLPSELTGPDGSLHLIATTIVDLTALYGVPPVTKIDYLQDLVDDAGDQQRNLVGGLARKLRTIAQFTDSAILAISSVSRSWYSPQRAEALRQSNDATQYMGAAKESGGVDFASAVVMFLDVDHSQGGPAGKPGRIAVAKSRHGEVGFAGFRFFGASGRFVGDGGAVDVVATAAAAKGAVKGVATRAGASMQDSYDDDKVIATVRHGAQPKTTLKEVCGIPPARAVRAIERCLGDRRLTLRREGLNAIGQMSTTMLVDLPGVAPAPAMVPPAPARALPGVAPVEQPRIDPALSPLQAQFKAAAGFPPSR